MIENYSFGKITMTLIQPKRIVGEFSRRSGSMTDNLDPDMAK